MITNRQPVSQANEPGLTLEIRIFEREGERYPVELTAKTGDGQQEFPRGYLSANLLEEWLFDPTDPATGGLALFDYLLADQVMRDGWQRAWGRCERRRIRLRIDERAPELHAIPWETLHYAAPNKTALPLAADAATPFSRYLADTGDPGPPLTTRPLKLLVAIANPDNLAAYNLAPIDVDREKAAIQTALKEIPAAALQVTFLTDQVTLTALGDALREGYHMLHLVAHGLFNDNKQIPALCLANDDNAVRRTKTGEIAALLKGLADKPRFIFLASCHSAAVSRIDPFRGFAPALVHEAGVPAVLAMQELVPMATAQEFARVFYRRLLDHGLVDLAANEARAAVRAADLPGAGIPVLFSRLPDNRLFGPDPAAVEAVETARPPFMVDDLPPDFVPRPHELTPLLTHLLAEPRDEAVAITTALRGAGGYGKTTLARAVCHQPEVRAAFPDGVLWVTLGEAAAPIDGVKKLYRRLTGRENRDFVDLEDAAVALAEALTGKQCLLVIDDVWRRADLKPFIRGGPRCARLITTRNSDTLPLNSRPVKVDAMRPEEAVALLEWGLEPQQTGEAPDLPADSLPALAARLGKWPLLLKLVNGVLRNRVKERGQSLVNALTYVNRALDKKGLVAFDARDPQAREEAVAKTLNVSFDLLDEAEYDYFRQLAIFPEDVDVPLVTLETLWDLDDFDVEELGDRLANLSLLADFNLNRRTLRLHDVIRAYLTNRHQADLPALHARLLDAHDPTEPSTLLNPKSKIQNGLICRPTNPTSGSTWRPT